MAANGITVKPMRLTELPPPKKVVGKYAPPSKRSKDEPPVIKVEFDDKNFPSLGTKAISSVSSEESPRGMLLEKIKERIRLDLLADEEKAKNPEHSYKKMSRAELIADGWSILSLASAKEIMLRPVDPMLRVFEEYSHDADSGISFSDYLQMKAN